MKAFMTRFLRSPALSEIPIPQPEPGELLIKVAYVALNPTDYKHAAMALPPSKVIGCDFSGTVVGAGKAVDPSMFANQERVAGIIHGCHYSHTGAFAEYLVADANLCFKVPETVPLEKACTLGVGWISATQALYQRLYRKDKEHLHQKVLHHKDQSPSRSEDTLLIYSAATNMGIYTVQQARLDHPDTFIIALASQQHHIYLKDLGADKVFDYKSPSVAKDIQALGRDIRRAVDCHSEGRSTALTAQCMLPSKLPDTCEWHDRRRIIRTLPPGMASGTIPQSVRADEWILSYTALGKPFWFLFKHYPAAPQDYQDASMYLKSLTSLLAEGKLQPIKHRLMAGGLGDIGKGFEEMRAGRVRGEKLVYRVGGEEGRAGGSEYRSSFTAPGSVDHLVGAV
ncbi:hypothetical protein MMC30_003936 [Trapelia coarctata]|nr:hypothetical protein [Trapelia coarctata]